MLIILNIQINIIGSKQGLHIMIAPQIYRWEMNCALEGQTENLK